MTSVYSHASKPLDTITSDIPPPCDQHGHHDHENKILPAHFCAVFRPSTETQIPMTAKSSTNNKGATYFVLKGSPLPWGTYPPAMRPPHGCIPPHLYYHVKISEYLDIEALSGSQEHGVDGFSDNLDRMNLHGDGGIAKDQVEPIAEWVVPFVHRIGNGNDHAGGLTTAYDLLEDLEDAEDFGQFIQEIFARLQPSTRPLVPSLYACTQVLVSEQRMVKVIDEHFFFADATRFKCPEPLDDLKRLLQDPASAAQSSWVVMSDLKLILP
ncbi:hypothetical protein BG011_004160 [Mortierella polycephala]|uniref:Uncharacterized protein n=1 Tax=Mortierella polycephala TaxID=41804 RepID=A0A9P6U326_9FUNG|nr:hypothetical protein BG011_004160 [Mortierella polycephala]